jgi:hypothetical protein
VHSHYVRHRQSAPDQQRVAPLAEIGTIEAAVDVAFWTGLRREEGYLPKISLALVSPEHTAHPLMLERPLPLSPGPLARLAPAVERPGIHLGVWLAGGEMVVWGTTQKIPPFCMVVEVVSPGLLVVKYRRTEDAGKFVNLAVLEGDQIKIVDETASALPDCPSLVTSLLGFESPASWTGSINVLVQVAVSMRAHGRGGSLLVVPAGTESWRESILHPISYGVSPPHSELADIIGDGGAGKGRIRWLESLNRAVDALAGLTAVDGATIITDRYEVLAFGGKIGRRDGCPQIEQVVVTEPIEDSTAAIVHPAQLGGTRHLSAAQFVQDQHDAVALVASQAGSFTIFAWSPCEDMVHAHRVDVLLL